MQKNQTGTLTAALEAIGFQKGDFMNDMTDITKAARERVEQGNMRAEDWEKVSADIAGCIAKHTNMIGWIQIMSSNEFNAYASLAPFLPMNVHLSSVKTMTKSVAKERIKAAKKIFAHLGTNRIEGRVDVQNSKVYGELANIGFLIKVNIGVFTKKNVSDRVRAFIIVHEAGHIFNQINAIVETVELSFQAADAFGALMNANPTEFKVIIDNSAKKINYKNSNVIRAASQAPDAQTAFMIYVPKTVSEFMSSFSRRDPNGSYGSNSLELAADTFAIRHGGYKELLQIRALLSDTLDKRHFNVLMVTEVIVSSVLKYSIPKAFRMLAVASVASAGISAAMLFSLCAAVSHFALAKIFGTPFKDLFTKKAVRPMAIGDYAEFVKRELSERAKEVDMSKEELDELKEVLDSAESYLETPSVNKNTSILRFIEETIYGSDSPEAVKDYASAVGSLMSNQLFIQAKLLEAETQS